MPKKRSSKSGDTPELPRIDPTVDFAFKRLFGVEANASLLIGLLNAVLAPPPGSEVVEIELRDPFSLRDFEEDKLSVVDLKVRDQAGRRFIVEMQMVAYPELRKRFLYYWADHYCEPLKKSESYLQLQPAMLIAFLCDPQFPETDDYHLVFRLRDEQHGLLFTEDLELHTIELSKLAGLPGPSATRLDRWAHFLTSARGRNMKQFPQEMLDDPIFQQAFRELEKIANNPEEREAYNKRLRNLREERWRIESTARAARNEGIELGRNEGIELGRTEERMAQLRRELRFLERVLHSSPMEEDVLDALPLSELEQKVAELEQQCLSGSGRRKRK